jgi:hypothetical protein
MSDEIKFYFSKLTPLERQLLLEDLRVIYCLFCGKEHPGYYICKCNE